MCAPVVKRKSPSIAFEGLLPPRRKARPRLVADEFISHIGLVGLSTLPGLAGWHEQELTSEC
jgi:hypothetical protein